MCQIASEIKAFLPFGWQAEWDVQSIKDVGWLCDRRTLFKDVKSINPGHYFTLTSFSTVSQHKYWDLDFKDKVKRPPLHTYEVFLIIHSTKWKHERRTR
jgi:asparagine synthase (glutamine-hydrolysing)